jgi:TRAP-type C4-dicarboxylate transport system permease small subunit
MSPDAARRDHALAAPMDALYQGCIWVSGVAIALMAIIIPIGVFTRYVLGTGSQWPEPIAILLMMSFTFIGAAAAYRAGGHIGVSMLTAAMPGPLRRLVARLVDLLMITICCFVAWYGTSLCLQTMHQSVSELPWLPVGITYAAIPIGALATLLFVIERMAFGPQGERPVVRIGDAP